MFTRKLLFYMCRQGSNLLCVDKKFISDLSTKKDIIPYMLTGKSSIMCRQGSHPSCVYKEVIPYVWTMKLSVMLQQGTYSLFVNNKVTLYMLTMKSPLLCFQGIIPYVMTNKLSLMCCNALILSLIPRSFIHFEETTPRS